MRFEVDGDALRDIEGLRRGGGSPALWDAAAAIEADPIRSHPLLAPWRAVLRSPGLPAKDHLPSIEALPRRARNGGPPLRVRPLVDAYNAISLRHMVPFGAFDLARVVGDIRLGRTIGGEPFPPMGAASVETVRTGKFCHLDDARVLTRHVVWRRSEYAKIGPGTRELFLVSELLPPAHAVLSDYVRLARDLDGSAQVALLDARLRVSTRSG